MIRARTVSADRPADLEVALRRMGLLGPGGETVRDRVAGRHVLLTGLGHGEVELLGRLTAAPRQEPLPELTWGQKAHGPGTALLSGGKAQFSRLADEVGGLPELRRALEGVLAADAAPGGITIGRKQFEFGRRTYLMGVVNVTPDSFSDGGRFLEPSAAVLHAEALVRAGADLLDVGGESSRPGARSVPGDEEIRRVVPVIEQLAARVDVPISVDTTKAAVARAALEAGAAMVNDISGFHHDPELPRVAAQASAAVCLMHVRGTPETMQNHPTYEDLMDEVLEYLEQGISTAVAAGVRRERILVDPGIGFGKTPGHNLFLLRRLGELRTLGQPILVGTSRKSFLGAVTGGRSVGERLAATLGSVAAIAALGGADVLRVHDVAEARDAVRVADAIREANEGGRLA